MTGLILLAILLPVVLVVGAFVAMFNNRFALAGILFVSALVTGYPVLWVMSNNPRGCC